MNNFWFGLGGFMIGMLAMFVLEEYYYSQIKKEWKKSCDSWSDVYDRMNKSWQELYKELSSKYIELWKEYLNRGR